MNKKQKLSYDFIMASSLIALFCTMIILVSIEQRSIKKQIFRLNQDIIATQDLIIQEKGINLTDKVGYYNGFYVVIQTRDVPLDYIFETATHEIAHHMLNDEIKPIKFDEWQQIHNDSAEFITEYAQTDAEEDFAESLAYVITYCYNQNSVKDLSKERQAFFNENIRPKFVGCN